MDATETGLVVPIPSLQEFVSEWRPKVDRVEPVGVPAHVTVLYPFIPPNRVPENLDEMRKFFLSVEPFTYSLTDIGHFGSEVVYVRPLPAEPFNSLTAAVHSKWGLDPYGGEVLDPQPHVTIGYGGTPLAMKTVADAASTLLPINDQLAAEVWLMQGTPSPPVWSIAQRFALAPKHA